jgi:protein-tyrosine phosphatase
MPSILFICTANQFRSPIAALSFCKMLEQNRPAGKWVVESAGTWAKEGLQPQPSLVKIANRLGLKGFKQHRSLQVNLKLMDQFDLIIVMETGHKEALRSEFHRSQKRIFLLSEIAEGLSYNIADPTTPEIDPNEIADKIDGLINKGFKRIIEAAEYFARTRKASSGKV